MFQFHNAQLGLFFYPTTEEEMAYCSKTNSLVGHRGNIIVQKRQEFYRELILETCGAHAVGPLILIPCILP